MKIWLLKSLSDKDFNIGGQKRKEDTWEYSNKANFPNFVKGALNSLKEVIMLKKPNLLFVFADQMRGQAMGCRGNKEIKTPHLDQLASEGVLFSNAFSNCPVCTPSRGSLLTGLYPLSHKAIVNDMPILTTNIPSIGKILKKAGYRTGYIGKWHLDGIPRDKFTPPGERRLGFDYWAVWECHHQYFQGRYYGDTSEIKNIEGYEPEGQTDMAINFIRQNKKEPFCLFLSWGPPHNPYELVPDKYKRLYSIDFITPRPNCKDVDIQDIINYYAAITALDENFGRLMKTLDNLGLKKNTIVVFTSDHGDMLWSQGVIKAHKEQPWEESISVPLIIRYPEVIPENVQLDTLISSVDLVPTLLGLMNFPVPETMQGQDLSPIIRGEERGGPDSVFLMEIVPSIPAMRQGIKEWRGIRTKRYTYARWQDGKVWVLYDNLRDPYQMKNLADNPNYRNLRESLEKKLQSWLRKTKDDFLPWKEHIRQLNLVRLWNEREKYMNKEKPRLILE